jgi:hypothetical protein
VCKSNLKQVGTSVAVYFPDGIQTVYPPIEDSLDVSVWTARLLNTTDLSICPVKAHAIYLKGEVYEGCEYSGSAETSLALDGDDAHNKAPNKYVVYEDGHVE